MRGVSLDCVQGLGHSFDLISYLGSQLVHQIRTFNTPSSRRRFAVEAYLESEREGVRVCVCVCVPIHTSVFVCLLYTRFTMRHDMEAWSKGASLFSFACICISNAFGIASVNGFLEEALPTATTAQSTAVTGLFSTQPAAFFLTYVDTDLV